MNNIKPLVYIEQDVPIADYVNCNDVFFLKFSTITSDFVYLFDVYSNSTMHTLVHILSIPYLNSIYTAPFNISDNEIRKNLKLAKGFSFEQKSEFERIIKNGK